MKVDPKQVYDYLRSQGLDHYQALGILPNIQNESGFNTMPPGYNDGGKSAGMFQHYGPRMQGMTSAVPDWKNNWQGQVRYALNEREGKDYLSRKYSSPEDAGIAWLKGFENPAMEHQVRRSQTISNDLKPYLGFSYNEKPVGQFSPITGDQKVAGTYHPKLGWLPNSRSSSPLNFGMSAPQSSPEVMLAGKEGGMPRPTDTKGRMNPSEWIKMGTAAAGVQQAPDMSQYANLQTLMGMVNSRKQQRPSGLSLFG